MKGLQVAVGMAVGYFLGRNHRFKLAVALAVAGATGRLGGIRGDLLEQGMKLAGSSPELEKIVNSVRVDLFEAGKAAAKAAASRQVGSLSTKLQDRAETLRQTADVGAGLEETAGAAKGVKGGLKTARPRRRPAAEEEEEPYKEYDEYEEEEEAPRGRQPVTASRQHPVGKAPARRVAREPRQETEEEEEEEPLPRGRVIRDRPPQLSRPIHRTRR